MDEKKQYSISIKRWKEAEDWGWGISSVEGYDPLREEYPELIKSFVKERCPAICEVFYNSIQDGLVAGGLDSGHAIETMEEILAMRLDELLIDLAHEFCPELLEAK